LPIYRLLRRWKVPEIVAILLSIAVAALVLAGVIWFFSRQIALLLSDIPEIQKNLNLHWQSISVWINDKTNFSSQQQIELLRTQSQNLIGNAGGYLSGAALTLTGV